MKKNLRRLAWKVFGAPPAWMLAPPDRIDTISPRRKMIDNAVTIVQHNTREAAKTDQPGTGLLGDYLEFGVFEGDTFAHAYKRAAPAMPWMRFWAFDSFEGLPELHGVDIGGEFHAGQFACDERKFRSNLASRGVDLSRVQIVPGWFDKSLTPEVRSRIKVASIVYIDSDLYESTVPVLDFLTDLLVTGSVVKFDDWFCFRGDPRRGVQRAWNEWRQRNPQFSAHDWHLFGPYGKSFMMVKTA